MKMSKHYKVTDTGSIEVDAETLLQTEATRQILAAAQKLRERATLLRDGDVNKDTGTLLSIIERQNAVIQDLDRAVRYESDIAEEAIHDVLKLRKSIQATLDWVNSEALDSFPEEQLYIVLDETK